VNSSPGSTRVCPGSPRCLFPGVFLTWSRLPPVSPGVFLPVPGYSTMYKVLYYGKKGHYVPYRYYYRYQGQNARHAHETVSPAW
jgi:hypothetical protein